MRLVLHLILLLVFTALPVRAQTLAILTEELMPYNYSDPATGRPVGFAVDIVHALLSQTGIKPAKGAIQIFPWVRAYNMLEKNKNTLLFSMARSEAREHLFKWVGPIAPRHIWFWKLRSRKDVIAHTVEDVKKYRVAGAIGFATSIYLESRGFRLEYVSSPKLAFLMLTHKRVDVFTATDLIAAYYMKNIGHRFFDLEKLVSLDNRYDYYLALNKETADDIVAKLQNALDRMKANGEYENIRLAYLNP